jgi:hypothetical protein
MEALFYGCSPVSREMNEAITVAAKELSAVV